ncbi:helix-turn-helix domain-containing protein [Evansella clarkii]|uniref:helix-turn-helix domain-containing protein n=1 Tax=Evansella clarkii TaxID=79879 RepID=UPI000997DC77|nr:helix-turn-helix transcriptional regulator [Evansella clarkii]
MDVGAVLKAARKRKGLSQELLAEKLYMPRSTISKLENNKQIIDVPTFVQWAKHTNAQDIMIATLIGIDPNTITQGLEMIARLFGG